jgi:hypothetical protein
MRHKGTKRKLKTEAKLFLCHLTAVAKASALSPKIRRIPDVPQDQLEPACSGKIQKAFRHQAGGQHDCVDIVVLSPTGGDCTFRLEPEILDHVC